MAAANATEVVGMLGRLGPCPGIGVAAVQLKSSNYSISGREAKSQLAIGAELINGRCHYVGMGRGCDGSKGADHRVASERSAECAAHSGAAAADAIRDQLL